MAQRARLENWAYARETNRISGDVYGHPRFNDGESVITSAVRSAPDDIKEGNTITTRNTEYLLGKESKV